MKVEEPDLAGSYTYSDYLTWTWSEMTELIHGKIFKMSPAPSSKHQIVAGNLFGLIWNYLRGQKCQVFIAPFDVRLPSAARGNSDDEITTVVQPDICVVCDPSKIDETGCIGAPDWIVEILSPHTSVKDLTQKFDVYEEAGVTEYWVIHPHEQTVLVYVLNSKRQIPRSIKAICQHRSSIACDFARVDNTIGGYISQGKYLIFLALPSHYGKTFSQQKIFS